MKYLTLLLLISCATEPKTHCVIVEQGTFQKTLFTVLRCNKKDICDKGDVECIKGTYCEEDNNGTFTCVRRE